MCFFFQAEDGIRDRNVTGVQTCALPISPKLQNAYGTCHRRHHRRICGSRGPATVMSAMTRPIRVLELRSVRGTGGGPEKTKIGRASCRERVEDQVCAADEKQIEDEKYG